MVGRLLAFRKILKPPAIHYKDVEPTVVVVIEYCDAAAGRGEQKVLALVPHKDCLGEQARLFSNVDIAGKVRGRSRRGERSGQTRQKRTGPDYPQILKPLSAV